MKPVSSFAAKQPDLRLKKRVNLFTEGEKTEPAYFNHLNRILGPAYMRPINRQFGPAPTEILKDIREHVHKFDNPAIDEYWIVLDVDQWTSEQKQKIENWCNECSRRNFVVVSNPCFEIWLILHFEGGPPIFKKSYGCKRYYIENYGGIKTIEDFNTIQNTHVEKAICRAEKKDDTGDSIWPETSGVTTVYKLVKKYFV